MFKSKNSSLFFILLVFCFLYSAGLLLNLMSGKYFSFFSFFNIFHKSSDHAEFFNPVNNLIESGRYSLDNKMPYAGRLPGYIFPYGIFRFFFSSDISFIFLGFFQLIVKAISAYCLIQLLRDLVVGIKSRYTALLLYLFIPYFWHWDYMLHPNSVSASVCLILFYHLQKLWIQFDYKRIGFIGILISYLFFIRPFLGILFVSTFVFIVFIAYEKRVGFQKAVIAGVIYVLPFMILESAWIMRNYFSFKKIILLQTTFVPFQEDSNKQYSYDSHTKYSLTKVRELISAWGGETFWYFPGEMRWFVSKDIETKEFKFKSYVFTPSLKQDSLERLRELIALSYKNNFNTKSRDSIENEIIVISERYKKYFINENPFCYYFSSKFLRLKNFLIKNVTQDWPGGSFRESSFIYKFLKIVSVTEYFVVLFLILLTMFLIALRRLMATPFSIYLLSNILLILFCFSFLIEASHYSYFIVGYLSALVLVIIQIDKKLIKK